MNLTWCWCVLAICFTGAVSGGDQPQTQTNRHRRAADVFLSIVGEKPRNSNKNIQAPVLPVHLPIKLGGHDGVTLPVLVVPVPVYSGSDKCDAGRHDESHQSTSPQQPPYVAIRGGGPSENGNQNEQSNQPSTNGLTDNVVHASYTVAPSGNDFNANPVPATRPQANFPSDSVRVPEQEPVPYSRNIIQAFETSEEMVQSFIRQTPSAPELPAVVEGSFPAREPGASPDTDAGAPAAAPPLPRFTRSLQLQVELTVPRSDYTETFMTAWHAGSQTTRTIVEDGSTTFYKAPLADGRVQFLEMRVDRSSGSEVRRCTLSPLMKESSANQGFPSLPDMTEFQFTGYVSAEGKSRVERWQRTVFPGVGRGGAAPGEALTVSHEMLVTREGGEALPLRYTVVTDSSVLGPAADGYVQRYRAAAPPAGELRPDIARECAVLERLPAPAAPGHGVADGAAAHSHGVAEPAAHSHGVADGAAAHSHGVADGAAAHSHGVAEPAAHDIAEAAARFDPLREFAMPTRDPRHDVLYVKYKSEFKRNYLDHTEEAVRKTILCQNTRFVAAANRLASTYELEVNFLGDRLNDELKLLLGVQEPASGAFDAGVVPFPYSEGETKNIADKLPDEFDWRPRGAVSPVRFQGLMCQSCWAFAVAGATEGALFKKTNVLVPLSPQCLVDCGRPYGTNGCNGTWPSFAYDYVQGRGLPAWDEYTNYQAKVLQCKDHIVPPVTHISGHVNVTANSVPALKVAIRKNGPTVVILDGEGKSFVLYKKGVFKDRRCGLSRRPLNHAVLAVGWGQQSGEHFIIKNSWTEKWGDQGYMRIDPGVCAVLQRPSYPLVSTPDIDRQELRAAASTVRED